MQPLCHLLSHRLNASLLIPLSDPLTPSTQCCRHSSTAASAAAGPSSAWLKANGAQQLAGPERLRPLCHHLLTKLMPSMQCSDFAKGFIAPLLLAGEEGDAQSPPLLLPPDVAPGLPPSYLGPCLPTSLQRLSISPWMAVYKASPLFITRRRGCVLVRVTFFVEYGKTRRSNFSFPYFHVGPVSPLGTYGL